MTPGHPTGWHHPALGQQTGPGAEEEESQRRKLGGSSRTMGKAQARLPSDPRGGSAWPCQAAGQPPVPACNVGP